MALNNLKLNLDYLLIGSAYLTHLIIRIDFLMIFYTFFMLKCSRLEFFVYYSPFNDSHENSGKVTAVAAVMTV